MINDINLKKEIFEKKNQLDIHGPNHSCAENNFDNLESIGGNFRDATLHEILTLGIWPQIVKGCSIQMTISNLKGLIVVLTLFLSTCRI